LPINQYRRAQKYEQIEFEDGTFDRVIIADERKFFGFIPLNKYSCGNLLRTGSTENITGLSDPDGEWWEDDDESPKLCFSISSVFAKRSEIEAIGKHANNNEAGSGDAYKSDDLQYLNQAARLFWSKVDRYSLGSHPDNGDVAKWLVGKGYSPSTAKIAASIIRPTWAAKGRKPDE
jgi:hypothetical protein